MVRTYNKYEASRTFSLVNSAYSNVLSVTDKTQRGAGVGQAVVGACEEVYRWDVKTGELLSRWKDGTNTSQVTAIATSAADPDVYAVGYVLSILLHSYMIMRLVK
jgi:U3 small nucleolar RNA-associated protein 12